MGQKEEGVQIRQEQEEQEEQEEEEQVEDAHNVPVALR